MLFDRPGGVRRQIRPRERGFPSRSPRAIVPSLVQTTVPSIVFSLPDSPSYAHHTIFTIFFRMVGRQVRLPEYEDWLEEIQKQGGEFNWVTQSRDFPLTKGPGGSSRQRDIPEIIQSVLHSRTVQVRPPLPFSALEEFPGMGPGGLFGSIQFTLFESLLKWQAR